jgi:hypothetical protein
MRRYTNATVFGESTASRPNQYGAMRRFTLPSSRLEIACAAAFFQDGGPWDGSITSVPDIFVLPSSNDFKENRDPVLERIHRYDSYKELRPEFRTRLSQAYADGGCAKLKEVYSSLKEKYRSYGFNMERLLYDDLDAWIATNRKSDGDYVKFLEFIHDEVPESVAIAYDLAHWMKESGRREEARKLYDQCLRVNPEHHPSKWRLGLMALEEAGRAER